MSEPFDRLKRALMEVKAHQEGKIEPPQLGFEKASMELPQFLRWEVGDH